MTDQDLERDKEVAYYGALVNAWIGTKMERDRTLIALSVAGVGLLVTIVSTVGVQRGWELGLYGGAFTAFSLVVWSCVSIFDRNSKHIEELLHDPTSRDRKLARLDRFSLTAFLVALAFTVAIGFTTAANQLSSMRKTAMESSKQDTQTRPVVEELRRSLEGLGQLHPQALSPSPDAVQPSAAQTSSEPAPAPPTQPAQEED